jgi:hypothetical protein
LCVYVGLTIAYTSKQLNNAGLRPREERELYKCTVRVQIQVPSGKTTSVTALADTGAVVNLARKKKHFFKTNAEFTKMFLAKETPCSAPLMK